MQLCEPSAVPAPLDFDPIAEARRQWRDRWGAGPTPAMAAVTSIMRVQQILMARLNELLEPFDLTFPRYEALMLLRLSRAGALPLGKMGERLQVHPTSVTKIVDQLERAGYAERKPADGDRRLTLATITAQGREAADAATEVLNGERFATKPLKRDELERLWELLRGVRLAAGDFELPGR
jgi:DNA-binding MarR family transcriptional regulator